MPPHPLPTLLALVTAAPLAAAAAAPLATLPPTDYVLARLAHRPVVILGEGHWIRHDAELVAELTPELARRRITLAMETLRASDQAAIDRLLAAPEWDERSALALQRTAAWPYREYLEILRAAWSAGRAAGEPLRIVALGPDGDWRERGLDYDAFMAERVLAEVEAKRRVLVYCGIHHAFTRYHQPELDLAGFARSFMDRMGNILRRRLGERVFLITLHRPIWCGREPWSYCLPLDGAIDCLAAPAGRALGFDVAGTELGARRIDPAVYYARGYATLRLDEMTDGYIWFEPIEAYRDVTVIPLEEIAPDAAALAEVVANNPFSDEPAASRERLEQLWREEIARRADPLTHRRWRQLSSWRARCPDPEPGG
jgi:hypothetical protein